MTRIHTRTPVRIDLAGGTLDIWPIYLLVPGAKTLNLAIDLFAETQISTSKKKPKKGNPEITLQSQDQNAQQTLSWSELGSASVPPGLILHQKLLAHFAERFPRKRPKTLTLSTKATSPAGAGLGGSSALNISITGALATLFEGKAATRTDAAKEKLIEIARDVETQILGVPAGLQDYYGAMFGGLQELTWQAARNTRKTFKSELMKKISNRLLLFYSGQSRNSGINNWQLFKSQIDKDPAVTSRFISIAAATQNLSQAITSANWNAARESIAQEWTARRMLASGISTPEMNQALEKAQSITPVGFKVCGAGGGGCFMILLENDRSSLRQEITQAVCSVPGIRALPFKPSSYGLKVSVKPS